MIILYDCVSVVPHMSPDARSGRFTELFTNYGDGEDLSGDCYSYGSINGDGWGEGHAHSFNADIEAQSVNIKMQRPKSFDRG